MRFSAAPRVTRGRGKRCPFCLPAPPSSVHLQRLPASCPRLWGLPRLRVLRGATRPFALKGARPVSVRRPAPATHFGRRPPRCALAALAVDSSSPQPPPGGARGAVTSPLPFPPFCPVDPTWHVPGGLGRRKCATRVLSRLNVVNSLKLREVYFLHNIFVVQKCTKLFFPPGL